MDKYTEGWTALHWGILIGLVILWVISSVRIALVAGKTPRSKLFWFCMTLLFLGVPTWIKLYLDTSRQIKEAREQAANRPLRDLDRTGVPGMPIRCANCGAVLTQREMAAAYPNLSVCPRCNEPLEEDENE